MQANADIVINPTLTRIVHTWARGDQIDKCAHMYMVFLHENICLETSIRPV